jgi:hypothetical protein
LPLTVDQPTDQLTDAARLRSLDRSLAIVAVEMLVLRRASHTETRAASAEPIRPRGSRRLCH